jgi:hypothetical protein
MFEDADRLCMETKENAATITHALPDKGMETNVAVHNSNTKQWDICSIVFSLGTY